MRFDSRQTTAGLIADRMHTISEVAERAGTTVRALRHYEDLGLLKPLRSSGWARVYPPELVVTVCRIADMRRLGIPVPAIAVALRGSMEDRPDAVIDVLNERLDVIEAQKAVLTRLLGQFSEAKLADYRPGLEGHVADARSRPRAA